MADLRAYKCPNCGGNIEFDTSIQKCKCPFCDTEFEMEALQAYDEDLKDEHPDEAEWEREAPKEWTEDETTGLRSYVCKSCGGEIVADAVTGATSCPYCGNPVVMSEQFKGMLRPDYVIPFKLDKAAAKNALLEHYKGKKLLPKMFKDQNHLDEIKGIYVPFWLYDAKVDGTARYKATKVRSYSSGSYDYTETKHYSVVRAGNMEFTHVPVDGSKKMADELMESVEPFDFSEAVDFQTAYLSGFLADKYDVTEEENKERANTRVKQTLSDTLAETVEGYTSVINESSSIRVTDGKAKYALYPVWLLNTTYEGQQYSFAMNGQTGKFVGNLPVDKGLKTRYFAISGAIVAAVAFAVQYLFWYL
ncbi:MAG: hypothetical protein IJM91_05395 [Lachnospiraceae bacterium]|nr:hypothetical protein [Lachnospiraceae bacterium]